MFGAFEKEHKDIVKEYVRGATVLDLGSGDGERAKILSSMRPKSLVAVDYSSLLDPESPKDPKFLRMAFGDHYSSPAGPTSTGSIRFLKMTFGELITEKMSLIDQADVAYVSWPANRGGMFSNSMDDLVKILERIPLVIYTGCNVGGTACGWMELFEHFRWRSVKAYAPSRRNTLIVYGKMTGVKRLFIHHEEWAARRGFAPPYEMEMYSDTQDLFEA